MIIALQIISIISSLVLLTLSIINIAQIISNHKKTAKRMEELRVLQKAYEEEIAYYRRERESFEAMNSIDRFLN